MKFTKKINRVLVLSMLLAIPCMAQADSAAVDFLRSTGKIYSVVAVIAVIFIGIVIFLIRLDRKLTKLENHINNGRKTS